MESLPGPEGGGLGPGCKEDIASPSSVMVEETPGGGWDRGAGGHGHGDGLQVGRQMEELGGIVYSSPYFCWS